MGGENIDRSIGSPGRGSNKYFDFLQFSYILDTNAENLNFPH